MTDIVLFHGAFVFVALVMFGARAFAADPKKGSWQAALAIVLLFVLLRAT
jgi:hypothetical protein